LILVDSSGWIEYLAARPRADDFARYIEGREPLVTSAIQVYEIYKVVRRDISEARAIESVSALRATTVESLDESLALEAADISLEHGLAMADAIIFATARRHRADIVTADADFEGLPGVTLIR
jgi:predicted nucleic acid-binding protein